MSLLSSPPLPPKNGDADSFRFSSVDFSAMFDPLDVNSQDGLNTSQQQNMYNQEYGSLLEPNMNHEETEMLINLFHSAVDRSRSDSLGNPIGDNSISGSKVDDSDEYQKLVEGLIGSAGEAKQNKRKRIDSVNATSVDYEADNSPNDRDENDAGTKTRGLKEKIKVLQGASRQKPSSEKQNSTRKDGDLKGSSRYNKLSNNRKGKKGRCEEGNSYVAASANAHTEGGDSYNSRSSRSSSTSIGEKSPASSATDGIGEEEIGNNIYCLSDSESHVAEDSPSKARFRNNRDSPVKGNNNFVANVTLGKKIEFDSRTDEKSGDEGNCDLTAFASNGSNSSIQTISIDSKQRVGQRSDNVKGPKTNAVTVGIQCEMNPSKTILAMKREETMEMKRRIKMLEQQQSHVHGPVDGTPSIGHQKHFYRSAQHAFDQSMPNASQKVLNEKNAYNSSLQVQQFLRRSIRRQNPHMDDARVFQPGRTMNLPMYSSYSNREIQQESYHSPTGYLRDTSHPNPSLFTNGYDAWCSPAGTERQGRPRRTDGGLSRSMSTPNIRNLIRKAAHNETSSNGKLRAFLKEQVEEFLPEKNNMYLHDADLQFLHRSPQRQNNIPATPASSSPFYGDYKESVDRTYTTSNSHRLFEAQRLDYINSDDPITALPQQAGSKTVNNNRHLALFDNLEPSRRAIEMSRRQLQDASIADSKFRKFKNTEPHRSSSVSNTYRHDRDPQNIRRVWSHPV